MQQHNRLWNLVRPEVIALVVVPSVVLILLGCFGMLGNDRFGVNFWTSMVYFRFFGWRLFGWICAIALAYLVFSVIAYAVQRRRYGAAKRAKLGFIDGHPAATSSQRLQSAKSFALVTAGCAYAFVANFIAINAICEPSRQRVAWANEVLMRADYALFGTFVPFETHENELFRMFATPMVFCYVKLSLVLAFVLVGLLVFQSGRLRQFTLAFIAVMFLALPGWLALPAVTPSEAYRLNKPGEKIPFDIAMETAPGIVHLHPAVTEFLNKVEPNQSVPRQGRFFVTSIPSMHVAWGLLALWFGTALYSRFALVLAPWALLNALGAIFTLQHYAVDVLAAIVVTLLAVALVRGLIALEARCGLQPPKGYEICAHMRKDAASLGQAIQPLAKRIVGRKSETAPR